MGQCLLRNPLKLVWIFYSAFKSSGKTTFMNLINDCFGNLFFTLTEEYFKKSAGQKSIHIEAFGSAIKYKDEFEILGESLKDDLNIEAFKADASGGDNRVKPGRESHGKESAESRLSSTTIISTNNVLPFTYGDNSCKFSYFSFNSCFQVGTQNDLNEYVFRVTENINPNTGKNYCTNDYNEAKIKNNPLELEFLFNFCIEGLFNYKKDLLENNNNPDKIVKKLHRSVDSVSTEMNLVFDRFFSKYFTENTHIYAGNIQISKGINFTSLDLIYNQLFKEDCRENGISPYKYKIQSFYLRMRKLLGEVKMSNNNRYYYKYMLSNYAISLLSQNSHLQNNITEN